MLSIKKEIIENRLRLFFNKDLYEQIYKKQEVYLKQNKTNLIIYKIYYRQLCLQLDITLLNEIYSVLPSVYKKILIMKYHDNFTLSKMAIKLNISRTRIMIMNKKVTECISNLLFLNITCMFKTKADFFFVSLKLINSMQIRVDNEIKFLLRNNTNIDISYSYIKGLYTKKNSIIYIKTVILSELNRLSPMEQEIIRYKIENPFNSISIFSKKYNMTEPMIKKVIYKFKENLLRKIS